MSINSYKCRACGLALRLTKNWSAHRAAQSHYICDECERNRKYPRVPEGHGYVYLIRCGNHPGRYKIGKSRNPSMRCAKFNTACPDRSFSVMNSWYDTDYDSFEVVVHKALNEYQLPGTEWFEGDGENFQTIIEHLHAKRRNTCTP